MSHRWQRATPALLVLLLSLIAIGPALTEGYWWGAHDARHSVYFLHQFDKAFRDGVLWPRWSPDLAFGYGYPLFNVYGPLASFIGEGFHLLGLDLVNAVKAVFALSLLASGLAMYGFARRLWGPAAGIVAGVAYVFLPYHLADVYVRAALAESVAMVWLPLVFWALFNTVTAPSPRAVAAAAVAYAGLMVAHNGIALQTSVWLAAYLAFLVAWRAADWQGSATLRAALRHLPGYLVAAWRRRDGVLLPALAAPALGVGLGLTLSAIFWLPAIAEFRYIRVDQWGSGYFSYHDHFVQLWQLLSPRWGFGVSVAGPGDDFPFGLGLVPLLFAVAGLGARLAGWAWRLRAFFGLSFVAITTLMLDIAAPLWGPLSPILAPAQFPWRLLIFAGFALSLLAGTIVAEMDDGRWTTDDPDPRSPIPLLLALVLILGSAPGLRAEIVPPAEGPVGMAGLMRFQQSSGEMTGQSVWARVIPTWSPLAEVWARGGEVTSRADYGALPAGATVTERRANSQGEIVVTDAPTPFDLGWNITYYPGWRAYLLDPETERRITELEIVPHSERGHLRMRVPAGRHAVQVRFEETPVRRLGTALSLVSALIVALLLVAGPRLRVLARPRHPA